MILEKKTSLSSSSLGQLWYHDSPSLPSLGPPLFPLVNSIPSLIVSSDHVSQVVAFGPQLLVADVERQETTSVTFTDVQASFYVLRTNTSPNLNPCAIVRWKEKFGDIRNCAFSPTGDRLALAFSLGRLVVFDWRKNAFLFACRSHYGAFTSVAWSPDGQYLATGSEDDLVCVWASGDGQLMALADRHMAWVSSVTFDASHCDERAYTLASGEPFFLALCLFGARGAAGARVNCSSNNQCLTGR